MQAYSRKIVVVEMCGVLYECETNNTKAPLPNPKKDAEYFLQRLDAAFKVQIYYRRNYQAAYNWLTRHGLMHYVSQITANRGEHLCVDKKVLDSYGGYDAVVRSLTCFIE